MGIENTGKRIDDEGCLRSVPTDREQTICGPPQPKEGNTHEGHRRFDPAAMIDQALDKIDPVKRIEQAIDDIPAALGRTVAQALHIPPVVTEVIKEAFEDES